MKKLAQADYSFEFFPPKTVDGTQLLLETATTLATRQPGFFSVTFGAGGATRDGTIATLKLLQTKTPIQVAPHLSCMSSTREMLTQLINEYKTLGVNRIVALRGDVPVGADKTGEFKLAYELVSLIREVAGDHFHIEVAAYPEMHPQAQNANQDVLNLKLKFEAGANSAITQYFFNADAYFYFLESCAKHHIYLPIVPGIMPITQFNKLARFSEVCGAEIPRWLCKRLEAYGDDVDSVRQFGAEFVARFCEKLIAGGAPGLHFYTLNQAQSSLQILDNLNINEPGGWAKRSSRAHQPNYYER